MPAAHLVRHAVKGLAVIRPMPLAEHSLPDMDHLVRHRCNQRAELLVLPAGNMDAELSVRSLGHSEIETAADPKLYVIRMRKFPATEGRGRSEKLINCFYHRGGYMQASHSSCNLQKRLYR